VPKLGLAHVVEMQGGSKNELHRHMTTVEAVEARFNSFENDYSAKKMLSDLSLCSGFLIGCSDDSGVFVRLSIDNAGELSHFFKNACSVSDDRIRLLPEITRPLLDIS
jgi:hypothetical protein